jgi:hypothetical protein
MQLPAHGLISQLSVCDSHGGRIGEAAVSPTPYPEDPSTGVWLLHPRDQRWRASEFAREIQHSQVVQYFKEQHALRTEGTISKARWRETFRTARCVSGACTAGARPRLKNGFPADHPRCGAAICAVRGGICCVLAPEGAVA